MRAVLRELQQPQADSSGLSGSPRTTSESTRLAFSVFSAMVLVTSSAVTGLSDHTS